MQKFACIAALAAFVSASAQEAEEMEAVPTLIESKMHEFTGHDQEANQDCPFSMEQTMG